jgi:iron complex transport system ATP-binding protein
MTEPCAAVEGRGLTVELDGRPVLTEVDVTVRAGGWLAIIGPNGAGKTTLLRAIAGLVASAGELRIDGTAVARMRPRERARLVAYAPQTPDLPGDMTVREYVLLGRTPYISYFGQESREDRSIVTEALDRLDLTGFAERRLGHLSGGERQRVVLGRTLAQRAKVLLLDEPTTALDLGHQQQVLELVDRLRLADGLTVVSTLHDLALAAQYAESMLLLDRGRTAASGAPAEVLTEQTISAGFGARVAVTHDPAGRPVLRLLREGE